MTPSPLARIAASLPPAGASLRRSLASGMTQPATRREVFLFGLLILAILFLYTPFTTKVTIYAPDPAKLDRTVG